MVMIVKTAVPTPGAFVRLDSGAKCSADAIIRLNPQYGDQSPGMSKYMGLKISAVEYAVEAGEVTLRYVDDVAPDIRLRTEDGSWTECAKCFDAPQWSGCLVSQPCVLKVEK